MNIDRRSSLAPSRAAFDVLPGYTGYAIGSLIKEEALKLPLLNAQLTCLEEEKSQYEEEIKSITTSADYLKANAREKETLISKPNASMQQTLQKYEELSAERGRLRKRSTMSYGVEEMLPIDMERSALRIEHSSFSSVMYDSLTIKKSDVNSREDIEQRVGAFVETIFSSQTTSASTIIPREEVAKIVKSIGSSLETEAQITMIGSFATLPHVKSINPLVIRRGANLSQEVKQNIDQYYVLTEAVLGATFLGFGHSISQSSQQEDLPQEKKTQVSKISVSFFSSQGAFPEIDSGDESINLWKVYLSWQSALRNNNLEAGYPIGYKYRKLRDVLKENGIDEKFI